LAKIAAAASLLAAGVILAGGPLAAGEKEGVKVGDKAPAFQATDDQGKDWKLADHVGKKVLVLYFYPADFTGGCTAQACGFRDKIQALADKGVEVIAISGDSAKTHARFKKDHELTFTLLADEDGAIAKKYGIPLRKGGDIPRQSKDGTKFTIPQEVVINRWTVIIGRDGNVVARYQVSNAAGDSQKVLDEVKKLDTK
jgi:peroxiredoxin Q/BCP